MKTQTEMAGIGERTELGQMAFDVIEQKQHVTDEQEKLAELTNILLDRMRSENKPQFKASGYVFTIQDVGEKLKITKG